MNNKFVRENSMFHETPAAFFDLDGTVRHSSSDEFINAAHEIVVDEHVVDKISRLSSMGYLIVGMTNQAGVAFGHMDYDEMVRGIEATCTIAWIDLCVWSPFHPEGIVGPFTRKTFLRKPDTGMFALVEGTLLKKNTLITWEESFFVGDREEDQQCAERAGIQFYWAEDFFENVEPVGIIHPVDQTIATFLVDPDQESVEELTVRACEVFGFGTEKYILLNADTGLPAANVNAEYYQLTNKAAYAN